MFNAQKQPITILVDVVAKIIKTRWDQLKKNNPRLTPDQTLFAFTAFTYLTRREAGIYKFERGSALEYARRTYEQPLPGWDYLKSPTLSNAVVAVFWALGIFLVVAGAGALFLHLHDIAAGLMALIQDPEFPFSLFLLSCWIAIMVAVSWLSRTVLVEHVEAFAMGEPLSWRYYQLMSVAEVRSERQIILAMMGSSATGEPILPPTADPDIVTADENSVPIPPGMSEIIFSIDENAITEIRTDLTRIRTLHTTVFWSSFGLFAICVLGSLTGGLFLGTKAALVSGATTSIIGTFCYFSLRNARMASIALSLFQSYLAELRGRLASSTRATSHEERESLRQNAWLEFRSGLNGLWKLETRARRGKR